MSLLARLVPVHTLARRGSMVIASAATLAACSDMPTGTTMPESSSSAPPTAAPPVAVSVERVNPVAGASLFVDPQSRARKQVEAWRTSRPEDAAQMEKIASQPQAIWLGEWISDPYRFTDESSRRITAAGAVPVYVLYTIPLRDCGHYSAGGSSNAAAYRSWVSDVARGIGGRKAVVIIEPDGIGLLDCLSAGEQAERLSLIRDAVRSLRASGSIAVYIDAGNARWHSPSEIGKRLRQAGIDEATGFALNVSNFVATDESIRYGEAVSAETGGKHFVIDTSRNGLGPIPGATGEDVWCNPAGRALGLRPTTVTGHRLVDAFLWVKAPGESDGTCNGGPAAGAWWAEYALGLAKRSN